MQDIFKMFTSLNVSMFIVISVYNLLISSGMWKLVDLSFGLSDNLLKIN